MRVDEIFLQKREQWNSLLHLRKQRPKEVSETCPGCGTSLTQQELKDSYYICPECGRYLPVPPMERVAMIGEKETFRELFAGLKTKDPLQFPGYQQKLETYQRKLKTEDAVLTGVMKIRGIRAAVGIMDGRFLMGSMGMVVGERIARLAEYAAKKHLPLIIFCASGGARMQEGLFSLMQMAKTSAAVERFKRSGGLYISCLTNPTTGGVSASFANLGDIILAEPKALICFAGPRVIEQTIGQKLPEGFQRAEFLMDHGMVDRVVERAEMGDIIYRLLLMHQKV